MNPEDTKAFTNPTPSRGKAWVKRHPILTTIGVLFLIGAIGSMGKDNTTPDIEKANSSQATASQKKEVVKVSATTLTREYEENAVATEDKYKGKILEISGIIDSIDRDILDDAYITLNGANYRDIQCMFRSGEESTLGALKKGQSITVQGEISGELINVILKGCTVVQ